MSDELFARGVAIREEVFGAEHRRARIDRATEFARELEELVTRCCFGFRNATAVLDELGAQ